MKSRKPLLGAILVAVMVAALLIASDGQVPACNSETEKEFCRGN